MTDAAGSRAGSGQRCTPGLGALRLAVTLLGMTGHERWPGAVGSGFPPVANVGTLLRRRLSGQEAPCLLSSYCLGKRGSRVQLGWGRLEDSGW